MASRPFLDTAEYTDRRVDAFTDASETEEIIHATDITYNDPSFKSGPLRVFGGVFGAEQDGSATFTGKPFSTSDVTFDVDLRTFTINGVQPYIPTTFDPPPQEFFVNSEHH